MAKRDREYNGHIFKDDGSGKLFNADLKKYLIYRPYPLLVDEVNEGDKIEPDNKQEYTSEQLKTKFGTDDTELINAGREKEDQVAKVEDKKSKQDDYESKVYGSDVRKADERMKEVFGEDFRYDEDSIINQTPEQAKANLENAQKESYKAQQEWDEKIKEINRKDNPYATNNEGGTDDNSSRFAQEAIDYWTEKNEEFKAERGEDDEMYKSFIDRWEFEKERRLKGEENAHPQNLINEVKNYKQKYTDEYHSAKDVFLARWKGSLNRNNGEITDSLKNTRILEESEDYVLHATKDKDGEVWMTLTSSYDPKSRFQEMPEIYYQEDYKGGIKQGSAQVNWAAYGSVSPDKAKEFAGKLQKAVDFAERLNRGKDYSDLWR